MGQITQPWSLLLLKENKEMRREKQVMGSALGFMVRRKHADVT